MTADLVALCFDANDPPRWPASGRRAGPGAGRRRRHAPARRRHRVPDPVPSDRGGEGRAEPDALRPDQRVARGPAGDGGEGARARRPAHRHRSAPRGGARGARRPRGQRVLRHRAGQQLPRRLRVHRGASCDGTQEVGYFWSEALGWPLVWDQDEETAIQSPRGGPKITWGGPPLTPKTGKNRLHFDLAPLLDGDQQAEVDRLVSLGATRVDRPGRRRWVPCMADPDGNERSALGRRRSVASVRSQGRPLDEAFSPLFGSAAGGLAELPQDWVVSER